MQQLERRATFAATCLLLAKRHFLRGTELCNVFACLIASIHAERISSSTAQPLCLEAGRMANHEPDTRRGMPAELYQMADVDNMRGERCHRPRTPLTSPAAAVVNGVRPPVLPGPPFGCRRHRASGTIDGGRSNHRRISQHDDCARAHRARRWNYLHARVGIRHGDRYDGQGR
jgi:hypothetical protein